MTPSKEFRPTPQQEALLRSAVSNVLVSAAAGSGKTQVMTDRIVERVALGHIDVGDILVMTFTEAAAANMRRKIVDKLRAAADAAPREEARRLRRQAALLPHAAISTIHGFCLDVLRNASYQAVDAQGKPLLEPGFRVADAAEAEILRLEALDRVLTARYVASELAIDTNGDVGTDLFLDLVDAYGDHRGDAPVRSLALGLHIFLRSMPEYRTWVDREVEALRSAVADFGGSEQARVLLVQLKALLDRAAEAFPALYDALASNLTFVADPKKDWVWNENLHTTLQILEQIRDLLDGDGLESGATDPGLWDQVYEAGRRIPIVKLPSRLKTAPPERLAFLDAFIERVAEPVHLLNGALGSSSNRKKFTANTRYLFHAPAAVIGSGMAPTVPLCEALFHLVLDLDDEYAVLKRGAGVVDFSDFEHLALAALDREGPGGAYRTRFKEIYIDEYQDTSGIQEAIVQRLARGNLFLVGDVKQSIYRFRHARPEIFQRKAEEYARDVPAGMEDSVLPNGVLRELNRNFRSLPNILAATNLVFERIMSLEAGEVAYDGTQALVANREAGEGGGAPVELVLVDIRPPGFDSDGIEASLSAEERGDEDREAEAENGSEVESASDSESSEEAGRAGGTEGWVDSLKPEEVDKQTLEAMWVAGRIRQLADEARAQGRETVYDGIAVLSRTRTVAAVLGQVLSQQGIPVEEDPAGEFLASLELRTMEALVHLLDNPRQDIPLAAVMQSSLYPETFSEEEMLAVRVQGSGKGTRSAFFHETLDSFVERGVSPELRGKAARFLAWVGELRERAAHSGLDALIGHVYLSTGYLDRVARLSDGPARVADLRTFHEWARAFESTRLRGLYGFARYIERMREQGGAEVVRGARPGGRDAVHVLTMHRSKGLEYPVVFLVGLGRVFNLSETKDRVLVSEALGIGPDVVDRSLRAVYPSHLKIALWEKSRRAMLAEEMRLLYVAMTRAEDRLFLVASTQSKPEGPDERFTRIVEDAFATPDGTVPPFRVLSAKCMFEWLLMAFSAVHPNGIARLIGLEESETDGTRRPEAGSPGVWIPRRVTRADVDYLLQIPSLPDALPSSEAASSPSSTAASSSVSATAPATSAEEPYRFDGSAKAPSKISVSELKRRRAPQPDDEGEEEGGDAILPGADEVVDEDGRRLRVRFGALKSVDLEMKDLPLPLPMPAAGMEGSTGSDGNAVRPLPPNEVGTAVHSVLRYLDLKRAADVGNEAEVLRQIDRMLEHRMLSVEEAGASRAFSASLAAFATSGLTRRILAAGDRAYREIPFTLSVPCTELYAAVPDAGAFAPEDRVMVQGIVDLWFVENGYAVLVDYKTDRIEGDDEAVAATLRRRYASQLDYYAKAVEAAAGVKVGERVLWMVRSGKAFRI
jgi:ATP-dependent helicase/nuclease subunit A